MSIKIRYHRVQYLLASCGLLGFLGLIKWHDPRVDGNFPTCPWLCLTGTHCPGCGTMRALRNLMEFDLASAFSNNSLTVISIPLIVYLLFYGVLGELGVRNKLPDARKIGSKYLLGFVLLILTFWISRNVPVHPFSLLAPIPHATN